MDGQRGELVGSGAREPAAASTGDEVDGAGEEAEREGQLGVRAFHAVAPGMLGGKAAVRQQAGTVP
jgi:hypothetical protein